MEKYLVDRHWFRTDKFKIVDEFPDGYVVWAIGRENFRHRCYIPLVKQRPGSFEIEINSLLALNVSSEELALRILNKAVRSGVRKRDFINMKNTYENERI